MAAGPEPPEWEPRWRKALRGKESKGSVEVMRKDLNDARDLHGQAESAAAVWKGHVMDRRKKALTDYKKLRAFFVEEEERFLQEAEKEEGSPENEDADPAERFRSLLQALSELERRHRNLGLSMLLQEFIEELLSPPFGGLVAFVKEAEALIERGQAERLRGEEARVTQLIRGFGSSWKSSVESLSQDVMRSFTNFRNGTSIIQGALTQLIQLYHRFHRVLSQPQLRALPARAELINIHHLMVELKKHKPNF